MAVEPFLIYKHSKDGEMKFTLINGTIHFSCNWPFDLSTDEWIYINNEFDYKSYVDGITNLSNLGHIHIKGKNSGYIKFKVLSSEKIKFEVVDSRPERPPSLRITLNLSVNTLLPSSNSKKEIFDEQ